MIPLLLLLLAMGEEGPLSGRAWGWKQRQFEEAERTSVSGIELLTY